MWPIASGTISTLDVAAGRVISEIEVGRTLADVALTRDERFLVAIDEAADELIVIQRRGEVLDVVSRTSVPESPVTIRLSPDGPRAVRGVTMGDTLTVLDSSGLAQGQSDIRIIKTIELPFSPRAQCFVADGAKLVVADAFGGSLAVIDVRTCELLSVRQLPGHNLRGLALSPDGRQLFVTHQVLNSNVETSQRNVFWGAVMSNVVRTLPIDELLAQTSEPLPAPAGFSPATLAIGGLGSGAGDPGPLAVTSAGDIVVALGGVREVAVRRAGQTGWLRETSGRRPAAIALSSDRQAFVANALSDSVSVIHLADVQRQQTISLGPQPELTSAQRGEQLFYDARLSFDGWFSCHSCHTDGHANGLASDNFGDGSAGAPKRVLSLLGTADTGPWAWDGHVERLEDQVRNSLVATMHLARSRTKTSLPCPPSCARCHRHRPRRPRTLSTILWQRVARSSIAPAAMVVTRARRLPLPVLTKSAWRTNWGRRVSIRRRCAACGCAADCSTTTAPLRLTRWSANSGMAWKSRFRPMMPRLCWRICAACSDLMVPGPLRRSSGQLRVRLPWPCASLG